MLRSENGITPDKEGIKMTIDEAIRHAEEVAETNQAIVDYCDFIDKNIEECEECACEHRQLAKWLRELKAYRGLIANADKLIESEYGVVIIEGYADVLSQMKEIYEEVKADKEGSES